MSRRRRRPLGRDETLRRDARLFVVACEDTYGPRLYFEEDLRFSEPSRVKIEVLETQDGCSGPLHISRRLRDFKDEFDLGDDDQLWLLLDEDHHFVGSHAKGTSLALTEAMQAGASLALSNPCFEVWLLLHHELPAGPFSNSAAVVAALRQHIRYSKNRADLSSLTRDDVAAAIERARRLDSEADKHRPPNPGTRMYLLVEELLRDLDP